jgi:polyhydroxyalkanoate synthesis regulator phasin
MRNKRLYNYITNTFGLTKDVIMEHVNQRLETVVARHIKGKLDSNAMESMILNKVTQCVKEGIPDGHAWWMKKTYFEDLIRSVVEKTIVERLDKEYKLEVKLVDKTVPLTKDEIQGLKDEIAWLKRRVSTLEDELGLS